MIYLDSSAVAKLVREEKETAHLVTWLKARPGEALVSSTILEVELSRALWREQPEAVPEVVRLLRRLALVEFDVSIRAAASAYQAPRLRMLDTVHLASAERLAATGKRFTAFATYDRRLASAAADAGLNVVSPGA